MGKVNWFEIALRVLPPGPTAATRASYVMPLTIQVPRREEKL